MAQFARQSLPRFSSTSKTSTHTHADTDRAPITIVLADTTNDRPTSVYLSTTTGHHYIGPDNTAGRGIIIGSAAGDVANVFIELAPDATLYANGDSGEAISCVWFYD